VWLTGPEESNEPFDLGKKKYNKFDKLEPSQTYKAAYRIDYHGKKR
jgi:hypothetical protein